MEEIIELNILPPNIASLGADFLDWIESIYDNDGNYNEIGMSKEGLEHIEKYKHKYIKEDGSE